MGPPEIGRPSPGPQGSTQALFCWPSGSVLCFVSAGRCRRTGRSKTKSKTKTKRKTPFSSSPAGPAFHPGWVAPGPKTAPRKRPRASRRGCLSAAPEIWVSRGPSAPSSIPISRRGLAPPVGPGAPQWAQDPEARPRASTKDRRKVPVLFSRRRSSGTDPVAGRPPPATTPSPRSGGWGTAKGGHH